MSLIGDIIGAYKSPKRVMQKHMERGITEPQTLFYGMLFGFLNLVASYPRASVTAPDQETLTGMMAGLFIAYIFFLPLMLYGIAAIIHWIVLRFGGTGTWAQMRRALNWSAMVTTPLILVSGITFIFYKELTIILNVFIALIFIWQLYITTKEIEFR